MRSRDKKAAFVASLLAMTFLISPFQFLSAASKNAGPPLVRISPRQAPQFTDDSDLTALRQAVEQSLVFYRGLPSEATFNLGKDIYSRGELIDSMEALGGFLEQNKSAVDLNGFLRDHFVLYRSLGSDARGGVLFSAYYEVTMEGSLRKTPEFRYPIYARPPDLVDARMEIFDPGRKGERVVGRVEGGNLVPYYTREEIDSGKILEGKGLEIAWARSPLDILFLQIQGSGRIVIPDRNESYHIRYAGDNGRPFRSIGTVLIESGRIPKSSFSRVRMIEFFNAQTETERQAILNKNPRYIFFEITSPTTATRGSLLVAITPEHSIATDPKFYPQGALAWIRTQRPVFDDGGGLVRVEPLTRFVLNQDEGGAIKGPGRVDFFVGRGRKAEKTAGNLWYSGELYFFVKKPVRTRRD